MNDLIRKSLAESSQSLYNNHWLSFAKFVSNELKSEVLPASEYDVSLYVVYLHSNGLKPASIQSYLSAIAFAHKIHGRPDPTCNFRIKKLLDSFKRSTPPTLERSAITLSILQQIFSEAVVVLASSYEQKLFRSLFLLMYHACLRVSEVTHSKTCKHNIQYSNIELREASLVITMSSFKHSANRPHKIQINPTFDKFCAIRAIKTLCKIRGSGPGPLFIKKNGQPLNRTHVASTLKKILSSLALGGKYNTHSFRIGKITDLALKGATANQLKETGRFHSMAFLKYIRPHAVSIPQL